MRAASRATIVCATLVLILVVPASADEPWGESVQVNDDEGIETQYQSRLVADRCGNLYAVWSDSRDGDPDIYFAYRPAGGVWSSNEKVSDGPGTASQIFPDIAVDGMGNVYVVWADYRKEDGEVRFSFKPLGGTWQPSEGVDSEGGILWVGPPSITANDRGDVYVAWTDFRNDPDGECDRTGSCNSDIHAAYRPAGGEWQPSRRINREIWSEPPHAGTVLRPAAEGAPPGLQISLSPDGTVRIAGEGSGQTGPAGGTSVAYSPLMQGQVNASTGIDRDGNLYAIWTDSRNGNGDIYFSYCPLDGECMDDVMVNDDGRAQNQRTPVLEVDQAGNAYAAWTDDRGERHDVYFAHRPAGGEWSANENVIDEGNRPLSQSEPAVAVDEEGNALALWRNFESMGNYMIADAYFSRRSPDGTWSVGEKVNDYTDPSDEMYLALATAPGGHVFALWKGNPYGNYDIFFAEQLGEGPWPICTTLEMSVVLGEETTSAYDESGLSVTLTDALAGHPVLITSDRGDVDSFEPVTGTTDIEGVFTTIWHTKAPGTARLTVQDLATGEMVEMEIEVPAEATPTEAQTVDPDETGKEEAMETEEQPPEDEGGATWPLFAAGGVIISAIAVFLASRRRRRGQGRG